MLLRHLSFKSLLVASLFVVTLIPSLALVQTWWHLQQLAEQVDQNQRQALLLSESIRIFSSQGELFERSTRQWNVLREESYSQVGKEALSALMQLAARLERQDDAGLRRLGRALSEWGKQSLALLDGGEHPVSAWSAQYESLSGLGAALESRIRQLGEIQRKQWDSNLREKRQQADRVAILSLCLAVFSGLLLAWLLVRPLQQLRGKIAALSQGVRGQSWLMSAPADIVQLASALGELDHRLARLEEDKADFFRHVSHELKTPLAAIQEASSLLQDQIPGPLLPSQREIVAITLSNTRLLRQRVDALLRHDAANWLAQPLDMRVHELHALIEDAAASMRPLLQQKRITLELSHDSLQVPVDSEKFRTIIDNLLSNAIRFSPVGGVISVATGREADRTWVAVIDQGPGIAPENHTLVFQPFYSGPAPTGEAPGSGIGLTMVKTFAQLMGGDVESLPAAKGAHFRVWWPCTSLNEHSHDA